MKQQWLWYAVLVTILLCAIAKGGTMSMTVSSTAFGSHESVPSQYTCDGPDISPPIAWDSVPLHAKSIALVCDDPDAPGGTWVHWVCYDIPPGTDSLAESQPKTGALACGGKQGKNDFGHTGWGGPCPPSGTHRYFFKVYCLDIMLNLPAGKTKKEVENAMKGHIIDKGELVGVYSRAR